MIMLCIWLSSCAREGSGLIGLLRAPAGVCYDYGGSCAALSRRRFCRLDFGLSVFFKPGEKFSEIVGSPYYMAPEVLKRSYGPETDIWSAGVILYILLCGVPPFWAESEQGVAQAILRGLIDFKREPWPSVSEGAKSLVRQMLEPDPKLRLTAMQVLGILEKAFQCLEELKSPEYHSESVKEAISLALEKSPPCVEPLANLLNHLVSESVLTRADLISGCTSYGSLFDHIPIYLPKAPISNFGKLMGHFGSFLDGIGIVLPKAPISNFGKLMGHLVNSGGLDFKIVADVLMKMEYGYQVVFFICVKRFVREVVLESQSADVAACSKIMMMNTRFVILGKLSV